MSGRRPNIRLSREESWERVYVVTPESTKKVARVRHNPRVSFLVESGQRWAELVAVHLTGRARVVDDPHLRTGVRAAMDHKYAGFRTEPSPEDAARLAGVNMAVIEITPDDRLLTWDNNRLER
jgi:nitroimidazol reductase NimA-like FMN-containing flavoprotein (pyridoxamine 5'-phosphate oxidase superfamily)